MDSKLNERNDNDLGGRDILHDNNEFYGDGGRDVLSDNDEVHDNGDLLEGSCGLSVRNNDIINDATEDATEKRGFGSP
ncbi:hypothetical protein INT45_013761 [Circinella minor]|uniref:Uncharacterized protein n=1 Tax=Circinella minor TaxID=1195481 RepID=A0A8H7VEF0_9FUNG|nr:hypothetical protein INT45_013761 [Circinella minor]